ncbi:hypothetical protein [Amaricoccus macauensis]|uniref:hypothetical protein n=1 Tax=Amaricoccus macauensis TaxID=57001 RepID=UPI003C7AD3C2
MHKTISKPLPVIIAPPQITGGSIGVLASWLGDVATVPDGTLVGIDIWMQTTCGDGGRSFVRKCYAAESNEFSTPKSKYFCDVSQKLDDYNFRLFDLLSQLVNDSKSIFFHVKSEFKRESFEFGRDKDLDSYSFRALVCRDFTIVFAYDWFDFEAEMPDRMHAMLMLHNYQGVTTGCALLKTLRAYLKELTLENEFLDQFRFEVPTLSDILAAK